MLHFNVIEDLELAEVILLKDKRRADRRKLAKGDSFHKPHTSCFRKGYHKYERDWKRSERRRIRREGKNQNVPSLDFATIGEYFRDEYISKMQRQYGDDTFEVEEPYVCMWHNRVYVQLVIFYYDEEGERYDIYDVYDKYYDYGDIVKLGLMD